MARLRTILVWVCVLMASTDLRALPIRNHGGVIFGSDFLRIVDPQPQPGDSTSNVHTDDFAAGTTVSAGQLQRPPSDDDPQSRRRDPSISSLATVSTSITETEDPIKDLAGTVHSSKKTVQSSSSLRRHSPSFSSSSPAPSTLIRRVNNLRRKLTFERADQTQPTSARHKFGRKFAPGVSVNHHRSSTTTAKTASISPAHVEDEKVGFLSSTNGKVPSDSTSSPASTTESSFSIPYDDYDYFYYYSEDIDAILGEFPEGDTMPHEIMKITTTPFSDAAPATSSPRPGRTTRTTKATAATPTTVSITTEATTSKSPITRSPFRYRSTTESNSKTSRTDETRIFEIVEESSSQPTTTSSAVRKPSTTTVRSTSEIRNSSTTELSITVSSERVTSGRQSSLSVTEENSSLFNSKNQTASSVAVEPVVRKSIPRTESSSRRTSSSRTLSQSVLKTSSVSRATPSTATQSQLLERKNKPSTPRTTSTLQFRYTTSRPQSTDTPLKVTEQGSTTEENIIQTTTEKLQTSETSPKEEESSQITPPQTPKPKNVSSERPALEESNKLTEPEKTESVFESSATEEQNENSQKAELPSTQAPTSTTESTIQQERRQSTRLGIASSSSVVVEVRVESPPRPEPRRMPSTEQVSIQNAGLGGKNPEKETSRPPSSTSAQTEVPSSTISSSSPNLIEEKTANTSLATTASSRKVHTINPDRHTTSFLLSEPLVVDIIAEPKMSDQSSNADSASSAPSRRPTTKPTLSSSSSQTSENGETSTDLVQTQIKAPAAEETSKLVKTQANKEEIVVSPGPEIPAQEEALNQTQSQSVSTSVSRTEARTAAASTSEILSDTSDSITSTTDRSSTTEEASTTISSTLPSLNSTIPSTSNRTSRNSTRSSRLIVGSPRAQQGLAPQGLAPFGDSPGGLAPFGSAPQGLAPKGLIPTGLHPHGLAPHGLSNKTGNSTRLTFVDANVGGGADANNTVGYVVEEHNRSRFRLEEKTQDGFIIGEYGVVDHVTGDVNGVRYTADSSADPHLIYETLMKFLQL